MKHAIISREAVAYAISQTIEDVVVTVATSVATSGHMAGINSESLSLKAELALQ